MRCSLSLLFLLILASFPSISSVFFTTEHARKQPNKNLQSNNIMDPGELQTLFKIMDTMSSDQNWSVSHPNPCMPGSSWPGIECKTGNDNRLHVSRLDFGIPPNPTCKNTAVFPSQVFELPRLESVFFMQCFTHTKTSLTFPRNRFFASSSLQQLSFRSNPALTGPIPPQLATLKSLQILTLSQNQMSGQIPVEIFGLNSLIHLDVSYNLFSGAIPFQLGNLRNLVGLDMSYNRLTGSIPDAIGQLSMLQKLDLSSNELTGSIPQTVGRLHSLVFLALSNNKLRGKFPLGLSRLQSLQYFIMDDNPMFIPLPPEFGQLQRLQELRLANSGYSGTIPPAYSLLNNLSTLSLQNNRLTGEIPVSFGNLSHIYHLNLSRNLLSGVVPFNSIFLKRLGNNLDLSGNPGLCLSPSEAYGLSVGIYVCGSNKSGSILRKPKKSEGPLGLSKSFFLFTVSIVAALYHSFSPA